ncbi:MAG: alanine racemase, partial [Oscillospiraceae bacterium]
PVMAVIKANAYGHGAIKCATALEKEGVCNFAVSTYMEALELRRNKITSDILILGAVPEECVCDLCDNHVTISITSLEIARLYAAKLSLTQRKIKAHIKLDTGMNRHGINAESTQNAVKEIKEIFAMPQFEIEGIFTHLAVADTVGEEEFTNLQIKRFKNINDALLGDGIEIKIKHCANSAGVLKYPDAYFNMVRAGIILYGCEPDFDMPNILGVSPVMSLRTRISQIKEVKAGETIGYGRAYNALTQRKIATVSIGYADGLHRACSQKIEMLVNGEIVPQVGNICMDICMLDVTEVKNVKIGDVVTVFGEDNGKSIQADATAKAAGTICYEIITGISPRVPKFYV